MYTHVNHDLASGQFLNIFMAAPDYTHCMRLVDYYHTGWPFAIKY